MILVEGSLVRSFEDMKSTKVKCQEELTGFNISVAGSTMAYALNALSEELKCSLTLLKFEHDNRNELKKRMTVNPCKNKN